MTTDKYLSQISRIDHAIANKLEEIKRLSDMATSISISPKEVDVQSSGNPDKMGSAVSKLLICRTKFKRLLMNWLIKGELSYRKLTVWIIQMCTSCFHHIMSMEKIGT